MRADTPRAYPFGMLPEREQAALKLHADRGGVMKVYDNDRGWVTLTEPPKWHRAGVYMKGDADAE